MSNPLLNEFALPPFSAIAPTEVQPAIQQLLVRNRAELARLLAGPIRWDSVVVGLETMQHKLARTWSPDSKAARFHRASGLVQLEVDRPAYFL